MAPYLVTGSATLNAKLNALKSGKAKTLIRRASRVALKPVQEEAKRLAPVRSGRLRRSIKVRSMARSRRQIGSRVTTNKNDRQFNGRFFYAGQIEYGWQAGKRATNESLGVPRRKHRTSDQVLEVQRRNAARRVIKGQKFMKRAAKSKRTAAMRIYRRELVAGIRTLTGAS
ncbi:HK97 gp10 family phage protein [Aureliella helgolandensis]|uniref:Uncharacterized protein n=1 Tax=Aureliella helgolandensis TaxID=2527968 RepID=A0A518G724_9BACT|nr:HK97 gp10 family phage protein [Aureliella helgolandensis]QDV24383.1 hypothetical protein Q31a_27000 [Aureliella helgolandensis]